jgi:hypothetical protein
MSSTEDLPAGYSNSAVSDWVSRVSSRFYVDPQFLSLRHDQQACNSPISHDEATAGPATFDSLEADLCTTRMLATY